MRIGLRSFRALGNIATLLMLGLAAAPSHAAEEALLLAQVASQTNASAATNSRGMLLGIQLAFDQVNARGGINGRPVRVVNHDDDLNPGRMVDIVNKTLLPDPKVLGLIGFVNTGGLTALSKDNVFGKANIALIAPLQGDRQVIGADNVFPFRAGYADEVNALVQHAKTMSHNRIAVVAYSIAFGPAMAKVAEEAARREGMEVSVTMVDGAPDAIEKNMAAAATKVAQSQPSAVIMVCAGRYATELAKALRATAPGSTQLYALSVVLAENMVTALTAPKARGIVIAQAVPFPFQSGVPLVNEYQTAMKAAQPKEPYSFASLEGYAAGKIALEGLKRAGPNPTRQKLAQALAAAGDIDVGGVHVRYATGERAGWRHVELTMISAEGKLLR